MRKQPQAAPFTSAGFRRGVVAALPFVLSNGAAGVVMGVAYRSLGLDLTTAVLFSTVVYSATAQAVTLGLWSASPPVAAMVVACIATNARYLVMGAHLRQLLGPVPRRTMLPVLASLADASWLMTVAEGEQGRRDVGYLLGAGVPMVVGWIGGTALGNILPVTPSGPFAAAAAFLPLAYVVMLLPVQWRGWRRSATTWALSAVLGALTAVTLGGSWAMLVGGGLGTLASALQGDDA